MLVTWTQLWAAFENFIPAAGSVRKAWEERGQGLAGAEPASAWEEEERHTTTREIHVSYYLPARLVPLISSTSLASSPSRRIPLSVAHVNYRSAICVDADPVR